MTAPLFTFGGIASGLDTEAMIDAIMAVERNPVVLIEQRQADYQASLDAWSGVTTKVSSLRTAVDELLSLSDFDKFVKASSSDDELASIEITGSAQTGAVSFSVDTLAANHQLSSASSFSDAEAIVGAGTLTITTLTESLVVTTTAGTTLSQLSQLVNSIDGGVSAAVLKVAEGDHRLVISADATGIDGIFTASGTQTGLAAMSVVQQGANAKITYGEGGGAIPVERQSNEITDLIGGATITLNSASQAAASVTIDISRDVDAGITKVQAYVDAVNGVSSELQLVSNYDPDTNIAQPLTGDATVRNLQADLEIAVSDVVGQLTGAYNFASSIGIEIQIDGQFTLDTDKLRTAFETDFDAVAEFFARTGSAVDDRMSFVFATETTLPGSYGVVITQAGTRSGVTGSAYLSSASDETFSVDHNGTMIDLTVLAASTLASALTQINAQLDAGGITAIQASDDSGAIRLQSNGAGPETAFTVANDALWGLNGTFTGTDVMGTINGAAATGNGFVLTSDSGDSDGLAILVNATQAEVDAELGSLDLGQFVYSVGMIGRVDGYLENAEDVDGQIATASSQYTALIDDLDEQIDAYELRLISRERTLRNQFTAMEVALAQLQASIAFLTGLLPQTGTTTN